MQQIFFKNILLADSSNPILKSSWQTNVLMSIDCNGLIQELKPDSDIDRDFKGQVVKGPVIPGMVNNHSHAFQWAMAGLAERSGASGDSFWTWRKRMYDFVGKITPEDLNAIASGLYMQMLKAGYTSVGEFHYLHHDTKGVHFSDIGEMSGQISQAAINTGIGLTLLPVFYRYSGFGEQEPNQKQKRFINDHDSYAKTLERVGHITNQPNQNYGIAPHSLRAVNKLDIKHAIEQLDALQPSQRAPVHIHIAEQIKEVEDCVAHYKQRPVEWLNDNFDLDQRWCLVHATHMNSIETSQIAKSNAVVSICTTTEANLGDGFFPMKDYKAHQGNWAIGSDSHISLSAKEELRWLEYQQRLQMHSRTVLNSGEHSSTGHWLWTNAARGGGQSLGKKVGYLSVEMQADFIELNSSSIGLMGRENDDALDTFIFSEQEADNIASVWIRGLKVIDSGVHKNQDEIVKKLSKTIELLK